MTVALLPASLHRRMAWKNGGGSTTEIAVSPAEADLAGFDWRISMARIDRDGPFSLFQGVDRTLVVLEGKGIVLGGLEDGPRVLMPVSEPLAFPADRSVHCALIEGPTTDLNVMTRRGRFHHVLRRLTRDHAEIDLDADTTILIAGGPLTAQTDQTNVTLSKHDALRFDRKGRSRIETSSTGYLIGLYQTR